VLGDVTVRHPQTGVADVEQDVDGLAGAQQHGVLPHQIRLRFAVPGEDEEASGPVDVERVVHRVVLVRVVDESDLHPVPDGERPVDGVVHRTGLSVDELPDHVARVRRPVHLDHRVLPFQSAPVRMGLVDGSR
jgi:hypothetical protein